MRCVVWSVVPVVGVEPVPVIVFELLAGPVTATLRVCLAGVELVFVPHPTRGRQEQGLPVDLQFQSADGRGLGYRLFKIPALADTAKATLDERGGGAMCPHRAQDENQRMRSGKARGHPIA